MRKILVSLVGEQTVPNILTALHYKPDILWFITTARMVKEQRAECIENALKSRNSFSQVREIEKIIVDQDSLTDCIDKIEDHVGKVRGEVEYLVNLTGGNKVMALAAYEVFREMGERVSIDYVPLGKNEIVRIFPRKKPLNVYEIKERLNLEEYLYGYGFIVQNKSNLEKSKNSAFAQKEISQWIFMNYEQLKGILGLLYRFLGRTRDYRKYLLTESLEKDPQSIERDFLKKFGFEIRGRSISKDLTKDEIVYLTGGWFEEHIFNEVYSLVQEGILNDAMIGVKIESFSRTSNDLDVAFMKDNGFFHIECKTLGNEDEQNIIRDELYKKGAVSALLGKGQKRAMICTTQRQISASILTRANDYGIEILTIDEIINVKNVLRKKFSAS